MRSPALLVIPVKLASRTFSQSVPNKHVEKGYALADIPKMCTAEACAPRALASVQISLVVATDKILWEELGTNLELNFKFPI